jgi:hypothetical protein
MSDEQKKQATRRVPGSAVILCATLLSCCGLFAFILLSGHPSWTVIVLWALGTALGWRWGMRAVK